jgi:uncharacterized protein
MKPSTDVERMTMTAPLLCDAHTHVWPEKIAAKALAGRVDFMEPEFDGTVGGLTRTLDRAGISRCVVMGIADEAKYLHRTNEFIGGLGSERLVPFGTVHPDLPVEENIDSLRSHRVVGIKLHPLFQRFRLDDERLLAILDALGDEFPVIAHVGKGGVPETDQLATPAMLAAIIDQLPRLRLMATHFGGFHRLEEVEEHVIGRDVVLETSWPPTLRALGKERVADLIRRHGVHRVVFGSDWPMSNPTECMDVIRDLGLEPDEVDAILGRNLDRWLDGVRIEQPLEERS